MRKTRPYIIIEENCQKDEIDSRLISQQRKKTERLKCNKNSKHLPVLGEMALLKVLPVWHVFMSGIVLD